MATRNDLGQLASMQNKLVRIAIERLRLSLEEFVGELPAEAQGVYAASISPVSDAAPRVFLPTRPSVLRRAESLRLFAVTSGLGNDSTLTFLTRRLGEPGWSRSVPLHEGRGVFSVTLGPFNDEGIATIEYRLEATGPLGSLSDPPGEATHRASLLT